MLTKESRAIMEDSPSIDLTGERCDRCNGVTAATLAAHKGDLTLTFCFHHSAKHLPKLATDGWTFATDTEAIKRLTEK